MNEYIGALITIIQLMVIVFLLVFFVTRIIKMMSIKKEIKSIADENKEEKEKLESNLLKVKKQLIVMISIVFVLWFITVLRDLLYIPKPNIPVE